MRKWYVVAEEASEVLYREVFGPYETMADALKVSPAVKRKFRENGSDVRCEAMRMSEEDALAISSEERIESV